MAAGSWLTTFNIVAPHPICRAGQKSGKDRGDRELGQIFSGCGEAGSGAANLRHREPRFGDGGQRAARIASRLVEWVCSATGSSFCGGTLAALFAVVFCHQMFARLGGGLMTSSAAGDRRQPMHRSETAPASMPALTGDDLQPLGLGAFVLDLEIARDRFGADV